MKRSTEKDNRYETQITINRNLILSIVGQYVG